MLGPEQVRNPPSKVGLVWTQTLYILRTIYLIKWLIVFNTSYQIDTNVDTISNPSHKSEHLKFTLYLCKRAQKARTMLYVRHYDVIWANSMEVKIDGSKYQELHHDHWIIVLVKPNRGLSACDNG